MAKTAIGMEENITGAIAYLLGPITGILLILIEKNSKSVRFHAWQSTILFVAIWILNLVLGLIIFIGWALVPVVSLLTFLLWLFLMYKAYKGEKFKLPVVGDLAEQQA